MSPRVARWLVVLGTAACGHVASDANDASVPDAAPSVCSRCTRALDAGELPDPVCFDSHCSACMEIVPGCAIDARCGDRTTCLPLADNATKTVRDFRVRGLNILMPAALAQPFVQKAVFDRSIDLPICGESGDGSLNWLLRVDTVANAFVTGGAPPSTDPVAAGYCFARTTTPSGQPVTSATAGLATDGVSFRSTTIPKLGLPIFLHGSRDDVLLIPLSNVSFQNVIVSDDGNCIGSFHYDHVNADCTDYRQDCPRWTSAASIGAFIGLEEADAIPVPDLGGKSLCQLLTGATSGVDPLHCPRDASGALAARGDYCSSPPGVGGCADSMWFAATFAAAAVRVDDASTDPLCNGGAIVGDGGVAD